MTAVQVPRKSLSPITAIARWILLLLILRCTHIIWLQFVLPLG